MTEPASTAAHRAALVTLAATFALILAGALVTSRDAGLAVPDWPLAYGQLNPPRWYQIENIRTEHGHRIIAATVALSTAALGFIVLRNENRRWVRRLALGAVALILFQSLLGGLRVLSLSLDLAMVHGWTAQIFFSLLVIIATVTGPAWQRPRPPPAPRATAVACTLTLLIVIQLASGILIRHLGQEVRPLATNVLFYIHLVLATGIIWLATGLRRSFDHRATGSRAASLLVPIAGLQVGLGLASFIVTETMRYDRQATLAESWLPTLHVGVGAALLAASIVVTTHALGARLEAPAADAAGNGVTP